MKPTHIIATALIILITMATAPIAADTACETLLAADQDGDGKVTSADALIQLQAGNTMAALLILQAAAAGSINAVCPGCYTAPFLVNFSGTDGTWLFEEDMNIHVPLPAIVELKGHLPGYYNYIDYTFEIHPGEDAIPTEDALMFFAIRACPEELYCQSVNFGTGCGSTTPPGVVVDQVNRTVMIFSP